jgi:hypothetical protein
MITITIASSRFNQQTWSENCSYRERKKITGCIYCTSLQLSPKIQQNSLVFVVEMNNTHNKIEGIGLIHNMIQYNKYFVYDNGNYNRYIYRSNYRIDRVILCHYNPTIVKAFDHILFKEKTHLKRGAGITTIPEKLMKHPICTELELDIKNELIRIFRDHFQKENILQEEIKETKEITEKTELKKEHFHGKK